MCILELKLDLFKKLMSSTVITLALRVATKRAFYFLSHLVLTEVHGPMNHLGRSQFTPRSKQRISVSGLSLGLQNNSLPSAHATRLIFRPFPHSAEHYNSDK